MNRWRVQTYGRWVPLLMMAGILLLPSLGSALRICSYNVLNFPGSTGSEREDDFRAVINQIDPDVLIVQEMVSSSGLTQFLNNIMNYGQPGTYAAAPFIDGPDTDNSMFYKVATVDFISQDTIPTALRNISEYTLRPEDYSSSGAEFKVYSFHLKAGYTSDDYDQRLAECTTLRNHLNDLPSGYHFFLGGDYNMHASTDSAYQMLVGSRPDNDGRSKDPINRPGSWYDAYAFRDVHTQSTRTTQFGGGATGGMDDRFDQLLISYATDDEGISYIESSYVAYGNDGLLYNRLNKPINDPPNLAVGEILGENLHQASDHIPIYLDIQLPAKIETDVSSIDFDTVIVGATAQETLWVYNVALLPADELDVEFSPPTGFSAPGGSHQVQAQDSSAFVISMNTDVSGKKSGDLEIACDDVDDPTVDVTLSGSVLDHAQPSTQAGAVIVQDTVDFGAHEIGQFADQEIQIHNYGYDTLQVLLNVYDAQIIGGDGRFSVVGGFTPGDVAATPATYDLHFDDAGAETDSTYAATLTFSTRDQQGLPGGTNLSDVTFTLLATVESGLTPIDDLTIQKNEETVTLIWTPKSGADLYRIYSDDADPLFTPSTPTDSTVESSWTDPDPAPDHRYYLVRAVKGGLESDNSNRAGAFDKDLVNGK